jgi:hypothetical protein
MGRIIDATTGITIRDTSRPVGFVFGTMNEILKCVRDASKMFQVSESDVAVSANNATQVTSYLGSVSFYWPVLQDVQNAWPDYEVVHARQQIAHPCTVHFHTPGRHGQRVDVDVRSIHATRIYLGIGERAFEAIVHHLPGWRSLCPGCVVGIDVHAPGHQMTNPQIGTPLAGDFFKLTQQARRVRMDVVAGTPQYFRDITEVYDFVKKNSNWR